MDKRVTQALLEGAILKSIGVHIPIFLMQLSYQAKSDFHKAFDFPILGMVMTFLLLYVQHTFETFDPENNDNIINIMLIIIGLLEILVNQYILFFMTNAFLSLCFCLLGARFYFKKVKVQSYNRQSLVIYCIGLSLFGTLMMSLFLNINLLFMHNMIWASLHATIIAYFVGVKIGEKWEAIMSRRIKFSEPILLNSLFYTYTNILVIIHGTILFIGFMITYFGQKAQLQSNV